MAQMPHELSEALRAKLQAADDAIAEYASQQQVIYILIEKLGGSTTISLESMVTQRRGAIVVSQDPDTGATTISLRRQEDLAA